MGGEGGKGGDILRPQERWEDNVAGRERREGEGRGRCVEWCRLRGSVYVCMCVCSREKERERWKKINKKVIGIHRFTQTNRHKRRKEEEKKKIVESGVKHIQIKSLGPGVCLREFDETFKGVVFFSLVSPSRPSLLLRKKEGRGREGEDFFF